MKTLILPIKKKWFDDILHDNKPDEYRNLNAYYLRRLFQSPKYKFTDEIANKIISDFKRLEYKIVLLKWHLSVKISKIEFRNGYGNEVPSYLKILKDIEVAKGNQKYGAEKGVLYFVLQLGDFIGWINAGVEQYDVFNVEETCNHYDTTETPSGYEVCNNCGAYLRELGVEF